MRVKILQKSFMAEWQNKSFPEFLSSATREPPELGQPAMVPPNMKVPPDMYLDF